MTNITTTQLGLSSYRAYLITAVAKRFVTDSNIVFLGTTEVATNIATFKSLMRIFMQNHRTTNSLLEQRHVEIVTRLF